MEWDHDFLVSLWSGGAEEARSLRPRLRILHTSGYTDKAFFDRSRLDPEVPFLAKPYQRSSLAQKVRDALGQEPG